MKALCLAAACLLIIAAPLRAEDRALHIDGSDSVKTVLQRYTGRAVELRMNSGEKIAGKLTAVENELAVVSELTGADFYSAAIVIKDISAVVVRTGGQ